MIRSENEDNWTYYNKEQNSRAHEPIGEFKYPKDLPAISRFEVLNDVQVNVFRLDSELKLEIILIKKFFMSV